MAFSAVARQHRRPVGDHFQIDFSVSLFKWDQLRLLNSDAECAAALESYRRQPPGGLPCHAREQSGCDLGNAPPSLSRPMIRA